MLAQQRYDKILEILSSEGSVKNIDLALRMDVSSETIRKDLEHLSKTGQLIRVHGGAVPVHSEKEEVKTEPETKTYMPLKTRNTQHMSEKKSIVNHAIKLIKEQQVIALDYGSTSQLMAMALKDNFKELTVITNSLQNAILLSDCPGFNIIIPGGILNKNELTLADVYPAILEHFHVDIFFMSVSGIDPIRGCTDLGLSESSIQNWMIKASEKTIVLADSSKFGRNSLIKVCDIDAIDTIITDNSISKEVIDSFNKCKAKLIVAND